MLVLVQVFNFDLIGFTGTPFIDNYPTFSYIREHAPVGHRALRGGAEGLPLGR